MDLSERVAEQMPRVREELAALVAIPSVADPRQFPPEACAQAARWVADAFRDVGFADVGLHRTADGSDAVVGSRPAADPGAPTVLLYAHYDVQPPLDDAAWRTPPFELTEVDGRWYGRGAADCKGNILMHLAALRALGDDVPVNLRLVVEGSEEQGTGGLEDFVPRNADLLRADAVLVCDTGNAAVGVPAVTVSLRGMVNVVVRVDALPTELHSGMFGGPAPDALAALIHVLASLRSADGDTTVRGLDHAQTWTGAPYDPDTFRADAQVRPGEALLGSGTVSDMLWARPALTVLGIDCPPVVGSTAAIVPRAAARLNLRIPRAPRPPTRWPRSPRTSPRRHRGASRWRSRSRRPGRRSAPPPTGPRTRRCGRRCGRRSGGTWCCSGRAGRSRCAPCSRRPTRTRRSCCWGSRSRRR